MPEYTSIEKKITAIQFTGGEANINAVFDFLKSFKDVRSIVWTNHSTARDAAAPTYPGVLIEFTADEYFAFEDVLDQGYTEGRHRVNITEWILFLPDRGSHEPRFQVVPDEDFRASFKVKD